MSTAVPFDIPLGSRLKQAREHRGVSVEDMATIVGVHGHTIRRYENGKTFPNRAVLVVYAGDDEAVFDWLLDAWFRDQRNPLQANVTNADNPRYVTRQAA